MSDVFYLEDEEATVGFGRSMGQSLLSVNSSVNSERKDNLVVFLQGDLGTGKTTMTRGMLIAYGHQGAVKSPTYTLVEPYELALGNIYHFDLYRLGDPEELEYMGIRDYFDAGNLCLIEWPKRGDGYLPRPDIILQLEVAVPGRNVGVTALSDTGQKIVTIIKNEYDTIRIKKN
jgi:tRNA threonylcarbamoyladenosine biosynthesis protein TsaE